MEKDELLVASYVPKSGREKNTEVAHFYISPSIRRIIWLKDTAESGNMLTQTVLNSLPKHNGRKIIYGESSRFGKPRLEAENIVFKQIPYDVRSV